MRTKRWTKGLFDWDKTLFRDCALVRVIFQGKRIWYKKNLERDWIEGWEKIFEGCEIKIFSLFDSLFLFFFSRNILYDQIKEILKEMRIKERTNRAAVKNDFDYKLAEWYFEEEKFWRTNVISLKIWREMYRKYILENEI